MRALLLSVALAACSTVDGTPPVVTSGTTCASDVDCGRGRHCDAGLCALACTVPRDCGPGATCSSCGRCIASGARDDGCLSPTDRPCADDATCRASLGDAWACVSGACARACDSDAACTDLGRGFGCAENKRCLRRCTREDECWHHGFRWSCVLPAGVDPVANADAATPVIGTCAADDARITFAAAAPADPPAAKLVGIWGLLIVSSVRTDKIPTLSVLSTASIQHLLVRATRDGASLVLDQKLCATELRNFDELDQPRPIEPFQVTLPDRNLAAIRSVRTRIDGAPDVGGSFISGERLDLRGARLKNPLTDPLPSYLDLTNAWDQDRDGLPGLTAKVTGLVSGDLYQAQRWVARLHGTVVDLDHLHGLAKGPVDQTVLGSTNMTLVNDGRSVEHPQPDRSYFRMLRLRTDASCADVVRVSKSEGSWLFHTPHFDATRRP